MKHRKRVMIYVEGEGGGNPDRPKARKAKEGEFRKAWGEFLKPLRDHATNAQVKYGFQVVECGSGSTALGRFLNPLPKDEGALRILLVDAEKPVAHVEKPWQALGEKDDDLYLMVQCLESWLVTDVDAVRQHYDGRGKPCFNERKIPKWPDPEAVHRHDVQRALEDATATCGEPYRHAHGNVLIGRIKLEQLKDRLRSASRLYHGLKDRISAYAVS